MARGCGCKEVYRFPHITYPYSSCICSFLQQHPYFLFIFLMFDIRIYSMATSGSVSYLWFAAKAWLAS